jgi:molybdopterin-guanine dinucleotide biosynthesis protein A
MKPTGIILCGGKSKRMGQNKALLKLGNLTLIEHVINALLPITDEIILSVNNNELDFLPYRKVKDKISGIGPISGFYSCLSESPGEENFIVSCDSPFITTHFLEYLRSNCRDFDLVLPVYKDKIQTVTGLFNKSILPEMQTQINKGNHVPVNIFERCKVNLVYPTLNEFPNLDSILFNINRMEDYTKANEIYNHSFGA